ncbi:MAG: hypothetical protein ABSD99_07565 [Candidatus Bathyarchaeia archaeon]
MKFTVQKFRSIGITALSILLLTTIAIVPLTIMLNIGSVYATPSPIDITTGTNGATVADAPGTFEASGRWLVDGTPAISVNVFDSWGLHFSLGPGVCPAGRFNWITNGTTSTAPPEPASTYTFSIGFNTGGVAGTFYLYGFSADNSVQISLTGPTTGTWTSGGYPSGSASDFETCWPGTGTSGLAISAGTYTLTATVASAADTQMALMVYAVFSPAGTPPIPEYPLGVAILAVFMIIAYSVIRRKAITKQK